MRHPWAIRPTTNKRLTALGRPKADAPVVHATLRTGSAFCLSSPHEHPLPPEESACHGCGCQRQLIKTLVTQQIELKPAKAHIEEHVRYRYACSKCRAGSSLITTSKPPKPLEKSAFGASVLAWIIAAKFERHLPTYRQQEMLLEPLRMWLPRPLLAELLAGAARELRPLANCGLREILCSAVVQADETPVRYLGRKPGKSSTGYLFGQGGAVYIEPSGRVNTVP
ncbi:MAG: transposase [Planctomycetaceae bacterium]|nr:transposase [Planctomycetaceae bacterium]